MLESEGGSSSTTALLPLENGGVATSPKDKNDEGNLPSAEPANCKISGGGDLVNSQRQTFHDVSRIGDFLIGPRMDPPPFSGLPIQNYLARKEHTDQFYIVKIVILKTPEEETVLDIRSKILLHTEHSILSLLEGVPGVVHGHGLYKEANWESFQGPKGQLSWKEVKRVCLVMDCFLPHDFSPKYRNILHLWEHIGKETRLKEGEALRIFYKVAETVNRMHKLNIIHRDLKPTNIILNKDTDDVTLTGFCLAHHLISEAQLLNDRRGTLAIFPPEVVKGLPYYGKPSDVYSLGVLLFTMLFGKPPFSPPDLTKKIISGVWRFPEEVTDLSHRTVELLRSMMHTNWSKRPTVQGALEEAWGIMTDEERILQRLEDQSVQVVPELQPDEPDEIKPDMDCNFFAQFSPN